MRRGPGRWPLVAVLAVASLMLAVALAFGPVGGLLVLPSVLAVSWAARVVSSAQREDRAKREFIAAMSRGDHRTVILSSKPVPEPVVLRDPVGLVSALELRDPRWSDAVEWLAQERRWLADRCEDAAFRLGRASASALHARGGRSAALGEQVTALDEELRAALGRIDPAPAWRDDPVSAAEWLLSPKGHQALEAWIAVPADTVVSLPRATRADCDCRYGHWGFHAIVSHDGRGVLRECGECEPPTRWREMTQKTEGNRGSG